MGASEIAQRACFVMRHLQLVLQHRMVPLSTDKSNPNTKQGVGPICVRCGSKFKTICIFKEMQSGQINDLPNWTKEIKIQIQPSE